MKSGEMIAIISLAIGIFVCGFLGVLSYKSFGLIGSAIVGAIGAFILSLILRFLSEIKK